MKIIVLHGTDKKKLYQRLAVFIDEAKKRGWEIVNDVIEDTPSLLGLEKLTIIRDYKKLDKKGINLFSKIPGTIVVYNEGNIPASFLNILGKDARVEKYDLPIEIWNFLENINLASFHKIIQKESLEYVFAMIIWKMKQKYMKNFDSKYAHIISELAEIDVKVKTGKRDLETELDLLIAKDIQ